MIEKIKIDLRKNLILSTRGFWIYSPISIFGFFVSVLVANQKSSPLILVEAGIGLTLLTFFIYFLQIKIFYDFFKHKEKLLVLLVIPVVTGVSRGYVFYFLVEFLNLDQPSSLSNRILSSTFTTVFWLVLANYVVSVSNKFRYQYQSALQHYLLGNQDSWSSGELSDENRKVLDNLQDRLTSSVSDYLDKNDPDSFKSLSKALVNQINQQIRPLSKRILIRNLSEFPSIQLKQVLKDALVGLDFSWKLFFFIISVLAILSNISLRGLSETILRVAFFLVPLSILVYLYKEIKDRYVIRNALYNSIFLVFIGLIPVIVSEEIVQLLDFEGSWLATLTISPVAPVVIYVLTILRLTQQDRKILIEMLQKSSKVKKSNLPGEILLERNAIASYLHNTLQSELLALSRQLEVAATEQNPKKSAEILQKISSRVNRSIADDFKKFAESPLERLEGVVQSWRGILDITIDIPNDFLVNNRKNSSIVQAVEEIATNISRYDSATEVLVSATAKDEGIVLNFQSNGTGKLSSSKGSGSKLLNQIARTELKIEKNSKGTLITIEI